jgi:hypothetical protein
VRGVVSSGPRPATRFPSQTALYATQDEAKRTTIFGEKRVAVNGPYVSSFFDHDAVVSGPSAPPPKRRSGRDDKSRSGSMTFALSTTHKLIGPVVS